MKAFKDIAERIKFHRRNPNSYVSSLFRQIHINVMWSLVSNLYMSVGICDCPWMPSRNYKVTFVEIVSLKMQDIISSNIKHKRCLLGFIKILHVQEFIWFVLKNLRSDLFFLNLSLHIYQSKGDE